MNEQAYRGPRSTFIYHRSLVLILLILAVSGSSTISPPLLAQACADQTPALAVAALETLYEKCIQGESLPNFLDLVSVVGEQAIPTLRKIAASPNCAWRDDARLSLAKLGDKESYRVIKKQSHEGNPPPSPFLGKLNDIAFIGDDWAFFTLVNYLIRHANDDSMHTRFGPADGPYDGRDGLLKLIRNIGVRRRIPDLPQMDRSPVGIAHWKTWLEKHQGQTLSEPVYQSVSDPYLRCLARKVEWGFPDAILDIALQGGKSAESILRQFPEPSPGEPMGARKLFPEILRDEQGMADPYREIQGNLQAALIMLGDQRMLNQVSLELNDFPFLFEYIPYEALRKLKFAGGKAAVEVLVDALGKPSRMSQDAQQHFDECVGSPTPDRQQYARKFCEARGYFWPIEHRSRFILGALAEMVNNPPLPADAAPTSQNFERWKEWFRENKDHATFVEHRIQLFE